MRSTGVPQESFDFVFEAAAEGIEMQREIDEMDRAAQAAVHETITGIQGLVGSGSDETDVTSALARGAADALTSVAVVRSRKADLGAKEQEVDERLAGEPLSVRVLSGAGRKLIMNTYFSNGPGSRQQEFGTIPRTHRNGIFQAALLGQNALVLYPQWFAGLRMDLGHIVAPILRDNGDPNIVIEQRERGWRDGFMPYTLNRYDRMAAVDIRRLRELAVEL